MSHGSLRRTARLAGLFYLVAVLSGPFMLLYVPGKLFVAGDATTTASNILDHETLYRAYILIGLVSELFFVAAVLTLYRLLKGVNANLAGLMVVLILLDVPLAILGSANQVATLAFVRGAGALAAFEKPQRDALATLLIEIDRHGILVSEVFWGLWLLPLGILVYRSRFLPRVLGAWLFANGLAYVAISAIGLLIPEYKTVAFEVATPFLFGEAALMLWLLVVGAREARRT